MTTNLTTAAEEQILTHEARAFLELLHERFDARRRELLAERATRPAPAGFLDETRALREADWQVAPPRADYADRRVEITGPTDRKLVINALNSGAAGFMADFEDANSPSWSNQIEGQLNLRDAVAGTIAHTSSDGRSYALGERTATLIVRPRGLHLPERHLSFGGEQASGSLVDFGLFAFHCARALHASGRGVYLYLPKLEHHLEARWWNEVLSAAERELRLPTGTFRATVLIETLPAAFQMEEILYELRDHSYGLNAGRWDYIFSTIKSYADDPAFVLPDRGAVTMTVPFLRAYCDLLVRTCHERGAFAMGGMAALIPSRTEPEADRRARAAVAADKRREAEAGFDGTWVAHPDVVADARAEFDRVLGERPNQIAHVPAGEPVTAAMLLDVAATPGEVTEAGLRNDVSVAFRYISFWLTGRGAAGIDGMMEDAATAEIARAQIWQWIRHGRFTRDQVVAVLDEETAKIRAAVGERTWLAGRPDDTRAVFEQVALTDQLPPFLTTIAYPLLERR